MPDRHKVLAIMQARMSSTRLPGKVLKEVNGTPLLAYELERLKRSTFIDLMVVATSEQPEDNAIEELCTNIGVPCFRGSLNDVLLRYVECANQYPEYDTIVRVTGDCPLIDPVVVDRVIALFLEHELDYASNVPFNEETFPDGMDIEVFSRNKLIEADAKAKLPSEREHVTPFIRNNPNYRHGKVVADTDHSSYRLTVDNPEDYEVVKFLIEQCPPDAGYLEYVAKLDAHPEVRKINMQIKRNEGLARSLANENKT